MPRQPLLCVSDQVRALFSRLDSDHSGELDMQEMVRRMLRMRLSMRAGAHAHDLTVISL